jgi:dTDP-4-amino-4,6-dideoxygalactose transaminase
VATFHYVPLHSSPHGRAFEAGHLPITDRVASTLLRLPIHPLLADSDVARVIDAVRDSLK